MIEVPIQILPTILSSSMIIVSALYTAQVPVIKMRVFNIASIKVLFPLSSVSQHAKVQKKNGVGNHYNIYLPTIQLSHSKKNYFHAMRTTARATKKACHHTRKKRSTTWDKNSTTWYKYPTTWNKYFTSWDKLRLRD